MLKKLVVALAVTVLPLLCHSQSRAEVVDVHTPQSPRTFGVILSALSYLGTPYKWGGNSIEEGVDCSALVRNVFSSSLGVMLPRTSFEQSMATLKIDKSDLMPGDLLFFNTRRRAFSHVAIYIGDGKFVHAPRRGQSVRIENFFAGYWQKRFNGARRVEVDQAEAGSV